MSHRSALLLVDVQNDFLPPNGSLAVPSGDTIISILHRLLDLEFDLVIASQDYHPRGHVSFASSHTSRKAFDSIKVQHPITGTDKDQELWPDHCVQGTTGADFEKSIGARLEDLVRNGTGKVVRKGEDRELDAYSAFSKSLKSLETEKEQGTEGEFPLTRMLKEAKIDRLVVVGLATDFCVRATVLSALAESAKLLEAEQWRVYVVREGVRGVARDREETVLQELAEAGARVIGIDSEELDCLRQE